MTDMNEEELWECAIWEWYDGEPFFDKAGGFGEDFLVELEPLPASFREVKVSWMRGREI